MKYVPDAKSVKEFLKSNPHTIVIGSVFIVLFTIDAISFTVFISVGFFCLLLSEHIYDGIREKVRARKARLKDTIPPSAA